MLTGRGHGAIRRELESTPLAAAPIRKAGRLVLPVGLGPLLPGHCTYLAHRGYDAQRVAALWGVRGIGQAAENKYMRWRLFIPIHYHGEIVSWTSRSIRPHAQRRYMSASAEHEAIPHKTILYGADYARHAIIIHEGPLDVWATGPGAVATCGVAYTDAQVAAMAHYPVRVICFDAEREAQCRARALADALSPFPGVTYTVTLESGVDAADADPEEVAELRARFLE